MIMFNLLRQLIVLTTVVSLTVAQVAFNWNYANSWRACNNACYAVNCKGAPDILTFDSNKADREPRRMLSSVGVPAMSIRFQAPWGWPKSNSEVCMA